MLPYQSLRLELKIRQSGSTVIESEPSESAPLPQLKPIPNTPRLNPGLSKKAPIPTIATAGTE